MDMNSVIIFQRNTKWAPIKGMPQESQDQLRPMWEKPWMVSKEEWGIEELIDGLLLQKGYTEIVPRVYRNEEGTVAHVLSF